MHLGSTTTALLVCALFGTSIPTYLFIFILVANYSFVFLTASAVKTVPTLCRSLVLGGSY